MNIKGTKSEENIKSAFAGESMARSKYLFFAEAAKAEGNADAQALFERMAKNELAHAKLWFKLINDGLGNTDDNLTAAAQGENYEWRSMYPDFAKQARADGLEDLALMFEKVAEIESTHERTFLEAFIKNQTQSGKKPEIQAPTKPTPAYRCMFCGMESENPLDVCPVCQAIGAFEKL
ncbi:MAG: rubrerythrin family protein [Oscillospiraceae bacterium]